MDTCTGATPPHPNAPFSRWECVDMFTHTYAGLHSPAMKFTYTFKYASYLMEWNCMPRSGKTSSRNNNNWSGEKQTTNVKIVWRQPLMKHPTALLHFGSPTNPIMSRGCRWSCRWSWSCGSSGALISCRLSRQISCDISPRMPIPHPESPISNPADILMRAKEMLAQLKRPPGWLRMMEYFELQLFRIHWKSL